MEKTYLPSSAKTPNMKKTRRNTETAMTLKKIALMKMLLQWDAEEEKDDFPLYFQTYKDTHTTTHISTHKGTNTHR